MQGRSSFVIAGLSAAVCAGHARASIVWQHFSAPAGVCTSNEYLTVPPESSSSDERAGGSESSAQIAQRITLAGTDRFVTRVDLRVWQLGATIAGSGPCLADTTLRLYTVGGSMFPDQLLWEGTIAGTSLNADNNNFSGPVTISFFPGVTVPATLFMAVSHQNISNQRGSMGAAFEPFGAGGIGTASSVWALQSSATGVWANDTFLPDPTMEATFTAVPGPWGAAGLAALGLVGWSRRRR